MHAVGVKKASRVFLLPFTRIIDFVCFIYPTGKRKQKNTGGLFDSHGMHVQVGGTAKFACNRRVTPLAVVCFRVARVMFSFSTCMYVVNSGT
jgi:hypothetical protein